MFVTQENSVLNVRQTLLNWMWRCDSVIHYARRLALNLTENQLCTSFPTSPTSFYLWRWSFGLCLLNTWGDGVRINYKNNATVCSSHRSLSNTRTHIPCQHWFVTFPRFHFVRWFVRRLFGGPMCDFSVWPRQRCIGEAGRPHSNERVGTSGPMRKEKSKQSECTTRMLLLLDDEDDDGGGGDDDDDQWTNERPPIRCIAQKHVENRLRPQHFRFDYSIYTNVKL